MIKAINYTRGSLRWLCLLCVLPSAAHFRSIRKLQNFCIVKWRIWGATPLLNSPFQHPIFFFMFSPVLRMTVPFFIYNIDESIKWLKYSIELELNVWPFRLFRDWRAKGHYVAVLIESASTTWTGNTKALVITSLDLSVIKKGDCEKWLMLARDSNW